MLPVVQAALALTFPVLVIAAALRDLTSYTIPNWISLALIAGFALAAVASGLPLAQVGLHLAIFAAALAAGMAMFALRWIGGGDAKLFAAAALWLGPQAGLTYLIATCIAGGALALTLLSLRSMWLRAFANLGPPWLIRLASPGEAVPYGVAIAVGALFAFQASPLVQPVFGRLGL